MVLPPRWPLAFQAAILVASAGLGCDSVDAPDPTLNPDHLQRQVEDLRGLIAAAEKGELLPADRLIVSVDEGTVRDLARLGLPREEVVAGSGGRLRVRIDGADVEFRDGHGRVTLDGLVLRRVDEGDQVVAELAVLGRVDGVEVDAASGSLRGQATLIGLEVKRLGLSGESSVERRLLEGVARLNPQLLSLLSESLVLPVRLEREVRIGGTGEGSSVRIAPARFPLAASVTDLLAFDQRLWIVLDVSAGDWAPLDEDEAAS